MAEQRYTIIINEEQRALLFESVLERLGVRVEETEELNVLFELLEKLPEEEARDPGIHHGFCL